jgi:hypothetical protein
MTLHQKIASTLLALGMVALIFYLLRKRLLREEYSLIWLFCALAMVGVIWFYPVVVFVTHLIGAVSPTTTLFIFAFIFVLLLCLYFSTSLSRLRTQMKDLTQKLALLEAKGEEDRKATAPEAGERE